MQGRFRLSTEEHDGPGCLLPGPTLAVIPAANPVSLSGRQDKKPGPVPSPGRALSPMTTWLTDNMRPASGQKSGPSPQQDRLVYRDHTVATMEEIDTGQRFRRSKNRIAT